MPQEIERKFLVLSDSYKQEASSYCQIVQGYLSSVPARTVRIRIKDHKGYITIKGEGNSTGMSRYEWEREIPLAEAEELIKLCEPGVISKTRYNVNVGAHTFEVDEFYGDNQGLTVAEVELKSEDEPYERPQWLGVEVTGDKRYYNAMLMKKPFSTW